MGGPDWSKVKRAEAGKYVISYKVSDSSNNVQCESPKRTVIVRDTLPPVLTLHVRGSGLVQTSRFNHKGIAEDGTYTFTGPNNGHVNTPKAIAVLGRLPEGFQPLDAHGGEQRVDERLAHRCRGLSARGCCLAGLRFAHGADDRGGLRPGLEFSV